MFLGIRNFHKSANIICIKAAINILHFFLRLTIYSLSGLLYPSNQARFFFIPIIIGLPKQKKNIQITAKNQAKAASESFVSPDYLILET